jgi:hypothetical protein
MMNNNILNGDIVMSNLQSCIICWTSKYIQILNNVTIFCRPRRSTLN